MPKPTKLSLMTAADKERFLTLLRQGMPQNWACRSIRFSYRTLADYRDRAEKGEEPFATFIADVEQAQSEYVLPMIQALGTDAMGLPTGPKRERGNGDIKWILERFFPKDFAPIQKSEITGKDGAPLNGPVLEVIKLPELLNDGDPNTPDE